MKLTAEEVAEHRKQWHEKYPYYGMVYSEIRKRMADTPDPTDWEMVAHDHPEHDLCRVCFERIIEEWNRLASENAELREDEKSSNTLRERLTKLLTDTANALNGEPPPLTLWSWHDLAEKAKKAMTENAELRARVKELEGKQ